MMARGMAAVDATMLARETTLQMDGRLKMTGGGEDKHPDNLLWEPPAMPSPDQERPEGAKEFCLTGQIQHVHWAGTGGVGTILDVIEVVRVEINFESDVKAPVPMGRFTGGGERGELKLQAPGGGGGLPLRVTGEAGLGQGNDH
jgi:hypothetical protein